MARTGRPPRTWTDAEVEAYIAERSEYVTESGCRIWMHRDLRGYGLATDSLRRRFGTMYAHRIAYILRNGPVPEGLQIDHRCNVTSCNNPDHLQAVTPLENTARAPKCVSAINRAKTHCQKGHPYEGDNVRRNNDGSRHCRRCAADFQSRFRERMAADGYVRKRCGRGRSRWVHASTGEAFRAGSGAGRVR